MHLVLPLNLQEIIPKGDIMSRVTYNNLLQSAIVLLFFRSSEEEHITAINELEFLIEDYIDKLAIPIEEGANTVEPNSTGSFYYYNMPYEEYKNKYPFFIFVCRCYCVGPLFFGAILWWNKIKQ